MNVLYNRDSIWPMDLVLIGSDKYLLIYLSSKNTGNEILSPWPLVHYVVPYCCGVMAFAWVPVRKSEERDMLFLLLSCRTPMSTVFYFTCPFRICTLLCGYSCCPRASRLWERATLCRPLAFLSDIRISAYFSLVLFHQKRISSVDLHWETLCAMARTLGPTGLNTLT